jgi:hypothetical protein
MKILGFPGPALLLLCLGMSSCHREVKTSEAKARSFAEQALTRYCSDKRLTRTSFSLKQIGPEGDFPWVAVYVSTSSVPTQEVAVMIDKFGGVETSWDTIP